MCVYAQSYLTLSDPMDCSATVSFVHGIFQARILGGLPFPTPGDRPDPGMKPTCPVSPALAGGLFTTVPGSPCRDSAAQRVSLSPREDFISWCTSFPLKSKGSCERG